MHDRCDVKVWCRCKSGDMLINGPSRAYGRETESGEKLGQVDLLGGTDVVLRHLDCEDPISPPRRSSIQCEIKGLMSVHRLLRVFEG